MGFQLVAEFVGLMAFIPSPDCQPAGNYCVVDVAVVNGDYGHENGLDVGPHEAKLVVEADDVCTKRTEHALECGGVYSADPNYYEAVGYKKYKAVWMIGRSAVDLKTAQGRPHVTVADEERGKDARPGTRLTRGMKRTWKDLGWLASVYRASSQDQKERLVKPAYVQPPLDGGPWPVDALIKLSSGTLATGKPDDDVLVDETWDFATDLAGNYTSHTRALSDHVVLEADVAKHVELTITPFPGDTGRQPKTIYLKSKGTVAITFAALPAPPEQQPDVTKRKHSHDEDDPDAIEHFRAFYNLLEAPPDHYRIPWRTSRDKQAALAERIKRADPRALSSQDCPPALARRAHE